MSQRTPQNKPQYKVLAAVSILTSLACSLAARTAWSYEATAHQNTSVPCAVLENFGGDVEVLDPSRTRVVGFSKNAGVPCGGWVSSGNGWAIIHHRDGHDLRIGPNTFLEIPESHPGAAEASQADQVVLYRGEMFGSTEGGAGELRVITANARVRVKHGTALINFSPDDQDTQLVALEGPATLENRFEPSKKVEAKAGESTNLNFKLQRVIPEYPKAISIASLKGKLAQFKLTEQDQSRLYETAEARAERRLAADLTDPEEVAEAAGKKSVVHEDEKVVADRGLASVTPLENPKKSAKKSSKFTYNRNPLSPEESQKLKARWAKKMTAGEDIGERILYPDKFYGKPQKVKVMISDPGAEMDAHKHRTEDVEKKRLIEELSQIQE